MKTKKRTNQRKHNSKLKRNMINLLQQSKTIFFFLMISNLLYHHLVKAHMFMYATCSQQKFQPNTPFEVNLNSLFTSVVSSSSKSLYNDFTIGNDTSVPAETGTVVYGLYQCSGDLSVSDCFKCMRTVVSQVGLVCPYTYGASLQLEGCLIRYESDDFLGKLDNSLRFKKCSRSLSNDEEFFKRRDDVLNDLQEAIGFRVSTSGTIEGFAQCLGDLSASDCRMCLTDAVSMLKSLCGSAEAGDVFLGQCYARYWASGYYDRVSDSAAGDNVGKTVAIIVATVAGVAVIIVLLSFCRKVFS